MNSIIRRKLILLQRNIREKYLMKMCSLIAHETYTSYYGARNNVN